jgi:hypothetical protein
MFKPFNASTVSKTLFGKNNLEVTFVNPQGAKQVVNLSPEARHNLMLGLLARPRFAELQRLRKEGEPLFELESILNIQGVTSIVVDKHRPVLELILPQGVSVYISFPVSDIQKFQIALSDLEKALMAQGIH